MEIIQKPDSLSLLGNLKKFLISSNAEVDFSLSVSIDGADVSLLQESYTPDSSGNISIDIREVCGQYLKTNLPSDNVFLQSDALRTFTATIGSSSWSFTVVNASVRNLTLSALEYLQYNFLTLQPQSKQVSWHSPEYLTYYFTEQADVQAKFYLKSGGTETVTVATISPTPEGGSGTIQLVNKVYTINTSLSRLMALSSHDTEDLQGIVDVWVQGSVSRLSYIQRYVYAPSTGEEHHYFAVNSLGGIDTFTFIGEQKITGEIEHQAAENDDKKITVTSGGQRKYRQNTGYLGEASSEWLWEFLHSSRQWAVAGAAAEELVVVSSSLSQGDLTNLNSSSFDFLLARDGGLLPESRRDETFPDITVPSPVSDLFFLNPRIIDFPAAPSDAELVFPVQTPYSNEWSYLTLQELQERLSIAASLNHTHRNLSVLQALGESNGQLTYRGVVIGSGGGISLPIAISDVEGLSSILNNKANVRHSHRWADITDRPTRLTDFTNNLVPSWALAIEKPSYNFSEIQNKPTTLSGYGITDGYSSFSTTGSGNAITGVSGSDHALTFTKGNTFVDLASEQTISGKKHISYLDVTGAFAVPQVEPSAEAGKVFEYIDHSGSFGESSGSVTPADLKDLTLKINGVTQTTYNPASAAQFNVDLTSYAQKSWVEAKNYLQGITKAMVENVLTGNITSHTHSQYLTSHQSLAGYATEAWVQQQGYLTSHQSLADYALKSEIPTSMAWTAITGRPTKLSQFTNDIISSWALAASKPSYSWTEIASRPTALSAFTDDATHRLVSDEQISGWNRAYGELIMGTQTAATGSWAGVSSLATASDMTSGYRFTYWLPYAGSGNATLTLTFGDGTTKTFNLYIRGTSRLTTHYPAGTKIDFVYFENISIAGSSTLYTGAWPDAYYDSTIVDRLYSSYERTYLYSASDPLYRYKLCGFSSEGKIVPLTITNQTSGTIVDKTPTTVPLNPKKGIVYYNSTTNITAATTRIGSLYSEIPMSTPHYTFNTSVPVDADIFLKGSYDEATGLFTLDTTSHTSWYVFALKSSGNNYDSVFVEGSCYMYVGPSSNTANYLQLKNDNPLYVFKNGKLIPLELTALTTSWSDVVGRPTKLSDFSNDLISSWALGATKPSYSWSEIGSRPTTLSGYGITDAKIQNGTITLGENTITPLTSFTETDPTVPAWAKAANKPSYSWSEITSKPASLSGYGITDGYSSLTTSGSGNAITAVSGSGHSLTFTKGNTFVDLANEQTISGRKHISYLDVTGALAIPQVEPTAESGKVFEYIDHSGSFGESSGSVTPADLKDLTLKINGVTQTTYNPASAAQFNVDLTSYAQKSWVEAKNYLQGITKAMVENVLTGNITSHTHSQYLTSHQSLAGYATEAWVQQQGYLTSHQSLADYALKSEIPTSMAWTAITGRPTKLSQFTNDIISSWALSATKPSYSWTEINSRPTTLSAFADDATHRLVSDEQISGWNRAYGELIMGTQTAATGSWTGVSRLATASDMTSGYRFTYWLPYAGSGNATLTLTFGDGTTKTFNLYLRGASRLTTHFPAGSKIDFVYLESVSVAGSSTKYTGAWPDAYYDTTYSAGTKSLFDAGTNTANRVWSASVLASAVAAKEHSHLWADITDSPSKLSDFTNDLISSWALASTKPSYSWTEITSRPTTLASFSGDSTHRLVTDTQISNWNSAYGWGNHADAGYLTSFTESDPTVPAWAKTASKPSYTLDEVTDGSTRKLSNYVPTTRTINSKALSGNITLTLDDIANGTNRSLANYLPLAGGTMTGYLTFNTSSDKSIYANNGTLNQRMMLMSNNGNLSIGYDLPGNSKYLYLDGYQTYLRFGSSKNYSMTLWSDGTIRSSTGTNQLSLGYRSGNTIYPFKYLYGTYNVATKCLGATNGTVLYGVARFVIANTKKARTFAIKIPSSMGAYVTFKIVMYSPYNYCPASTITVNAGSFSLTSSSFCALYPSYSVEGSFAGRVAFARDGDTSSSNMYILLGSYGDGQQYQGGMIAIDSIIHSDSVTNADTIMNFGYTLLDLDSESMFTKITECVNADAHFKSVTVEDHVTAPKIDCTSMMLVPTIEPSSVPAGKVAEYINLTGGSFAN